VSFRRGMKIDMSMMLVNTDSVQGACPKCRLPANAPNDTTVQWLVLFPIPCDTGRHLTSVNKVKSAKCTFASMTLAPRAQSSLLGYVNSKRKTPRSRRQFPTSRECGCYRKVRETEIGKNRGNLATVLGWLFQCGTAYVAPLSALFPCGRKVS